MDKEFIKSIILPVGILIIAWVVIDKIFGISKKWKEEKKESERQEKTIDEHKTERKDLGKQGIKPSYPPSKYKLLADGLFAAMDGVGTDTNRVFQIISQLRNSADFLELQTAFDIRGDENLTQWINKDLSSREVSKLNEYLRSRKIQYSF